MGLKRMDNVNIIVEDMAAAIAFFQELGLELEGQMTVEGAWVDKVLAIDGAVSDIAMMRTPDGHSRLELSAFKHPKSLPSPVKNAPVNVLGIGRIMFTVDSVDETFARLQKHGATLHGEIVNFEDTYRLCFIRGPERIMLALAEELR